MHEVILLRPARAYLDALDMRSMARREALLAHLAEKGPALRRPHADILAGKIRELRCGVGRLEHRLLYFFSGRRVIVTHGFLKKTDAVPAREIERAERALGLYGR